MKIFNQRFLAFSSLIVLSILSGRTRAGDGPLITSFEMLSARTTFADGHPAQAFCVETLEPNIEIEYTENSRFSKSYRCDLELKGKTLGSKPLPIALYRQLSYIFASRLVDRKDVISQRSYRAELDAHGILNYSLPGSIFLSLDGVSTVKEEQQIRDLREAMAPEDESMQQAAKAACFVAAQEAMGEACSPLSRKVIQQISNAALSDLGLTGQKGLDNIIQVYHQP